MSLTTWAALAASLFASTSLHAQTLTQVDHGVIVTPAIGSAKQVRVLSYGDNSFRVTAVPGEDVDLPASAMVTAQPSGKPAVSQANGLVTLKLPGASAEVRLSDGSIRFRNAQGEIVLSEEAPRGLNPVLLEGQPFLAIEQQFNRGTDEGLFGLGQHQNGQMNYLGEDVELAQHNMDIAIPYLVSTRGYGLLWDNGSITRFGNPAPYDHVGRGLKVSSDGKPGWKAQYYLGEKLAVTRQEPVIDYQYIRDQKNWPAAAKAETVASPDSGQNTAGVVVGEQRVVWTGNVTPERSGTHKFRLYMSSYVKLFADGKPVVDAWRQNWNPWYRNFELPMTAGKPVELRIEWEPNAGYLALFHSDPLPDDDRHSVWLSSDAGRGIDYYFVGGQDMDGAIAGYRALTGKAELMPAWTYGFWQSRQRYETQEQLLSVAREYRKRKIPFDAIVQDWFYWPEDQWGCHCFDATRFPNARAMVDEIHALDARIMISVWPKFYPTTDNGRALDAIGALYRRPLEAEGQRDWVGPGYANTFYDPYVAGARELYFDQIKRDLLPSGFDAWWMDATEPDWHSNLSVEERAFQMSSPAAGPGAAVFNLYPLVHAQGMADGLRAAQPDRRPFILTRSGFGGIQRTSSALWSGDVAARWSDLRDQISAGVNLSMSGVPNWTHDIGGFAVEDRYTQAEPAHLAEWRELNLRWFQFGAFSPLFRSHGEAPRREIHELAGDDKAMYDALLDYGRLRYRLMPYIYTVAADTWHQDGTMMRGLAMDFAADRNGWNIDDQYLFGPALLVAPVTQFQARSRPVYLPAGADWYDMSTGAFHRGGQTITADAPRERMPLFVKAGSIIPTGPEIDHVGERPDGPILLHVFTGADGQFSLYEDDGGSPAYKQGQFTRMPLHWDEASGTLTIGAREGEFDNMPARRTLSVRFYDPRTPTPFDLEKPALDMTYDGKAIVVRRP